MDDDDDEPHLYPVLKTLQQCGFSDIVASSVTLRAVIEYAALPIEVIERAAEALGYTMPDLLPPTQRN